MAFDAGSVVGYLILNAADWVKGAKDSEGATESMFGAIFKAEQAQAAFNSIINAGIDILKDSVNEYIKSEQTVAQLEATLKSTGGAAGMTSDELINLSAALQDTTTFEDDAILAGENLLLTFTNIGRDVFPSATETMLDMSQALGQDLKSSAIQLGKALQDPIQGITALKRVGVNFTDAQTSMIEALMGAGKLEEAQQLILKELQKEFGGSAKAAKDTFGGALKSLQNELGNTQEALGKQIAQIGGPFVKVLTGLVKNMNENISLQDRLQTAQEKGTTLIQDQTGAWVEQSKSILTNSILLLTAGKSIKDITDLIVKLGQKQAELDAQTKQTITTISTELPKAYAQALPETSQLVRQYATANAVAIVDNNNWVTESAKSQYKILATVSEDFFTKEKTFWENYQDIVAESFQTILTASAPVFEAIGTALVVQGESWGDVGKAAIKAIAGIVKALGDQLSAMAAAKFVEALANSFDPFTAWAAPGQFVASGLLAGGAAAAWVAAGAINAWADSFAQGGAASPGFAIVGEQGPELINFRSPARVFPADETASMMGGNIQIYFTGPINSEIDLERAAQILGAKIKKLQRGTM